MHKLEFSSVPKSLHATIQLIGRGIKEGSKYFPIHALAAQLATRAGPRDWLGQVRAIFDDFTKTRWRYVHDPNWAEQVVCSGPAIWSLVLGGKSRRGERGHGDCDDATVAMGAMLASIGRKVRIATTAPPNSPAIFTHVFLQAEIPGQGWITVDPVPWPKQGLGYTVPHSRIALWDIDGRLLRADGEFPGAIFEMKGDEMSYFGQTEPLERYGFAGADGAAPLDWSTYGLIGFGRYASFLGTIDTSENSGLLMEIDDSDTVAPGVNRVRTKMLEVDPREFHFYRQHGRFRPHTVALADDGDVYQYQFMGDEMTGLGWGFFKKLFKKVKSAVKGVVKRVGGLAKKLISKLPGGKYLVRIYGKLHKIAMKIVRPLTKIVGKFASKLAPIAAIIPGYGPAIAGALYTAGKIAKVLQESGVVTDSKGVPKFKSHAQAKVFARKLRAEARAMKFGKPQTPPGGEMGWKLFMPGTPKHKAIAYSLGLSGV